MHRALAALVMSFSLSCFAAEEVDRSVSVVGSGSATAEPDKAIVTMAINARAKEVADAQAAAGRVSAAVLELTDSLDIDRDQVDTTAATVQPDYRWNRNTEEQELRGYIAGRRMVVNVADLEELGQLVEGAIRAGVNEVSPPQILSSGRKEAEREALEAAALDARANAEVLARTLDLRLGKALTVSTVAQTRPPVMYARAQALEADSAAATYNAADLTFTSTVNVTFELLD